MVPDNYIFKNSENEAGVPFTPDDIIASGILSAGDDCLVYLKAHLKAAEKSGGETFEFECSKLSYELKDGRFTSFICETAEETVTYTLNYQDGKVVSVTADYGDNDTETIELPEVETEPGKDTPDGEEEQEPQSEKENGDIIPCKDGYVRLLLGKTKKNESTLILTFEPVKEGGYSLYDVEAIDLASQAGYSIIGFEGKTPDEKRTGVRLYGEAARTEFSVIYGTDGSCCFLLGNDDEEPADDAKKTTRENEFVLNYSFKDGKFDKGFFRKGDGPETSINADGSLVAGD